MRPPLRADGFPSERHVIRVLAAVNEALPRIAEELFAAAVPGASGILGSLVADPSKAAHEQWAALRAWLGQYDEWKALPTSSLAVRLDMVRRLRFAPPAHLR